MSRSQRMATVGMLFLGGFVVLVHQTSFPPTSWGNAAIITLAITGGVAVFCVVSGLLLWWAMRDP